MFYSNYENSTKTSPTMLCVLVVENNLILGDYFSVAQCCSGKVSD